MDNKDLAIYIFAHNGINIWPNNDSYKLVSIDKIDTDIPLEKIICDKEKDDILKKEHAYSEGARIHYIWKNIELPNYVGFAHYRRYFEFFDKIPDMNKIFENHGAILPKFDLGWPSIEENYVSVHNGSDLYKVLNIIRENFPEYYKSAINTVKRDTFYPCNIFVLPRETFLMWCDFVFGVLGIFDEEMGFNTDLDVYNHVVNHLDDYCKTEAEPNGLTTYQSRIQAFLMERLSTIFFCYNFENNIIKPPFLTDMVLTEVHYDFEKTYFKQYENKNISNNN